MISQVHSLRNNIFLTELRPPVCLSISASFCILLLNKNCFIFVLPGYYFYDIYVFIFYIYLYPSFDFLLFLAYVKTVSYNMYFYDSFFINLYDSEIYLY